MSDDIFQRVINYQRRSVSVGDDPLRMAAENQLEFYDDEQITYTDYNQYITPCNNDGYVCTPLPRTNHRPTAKTCWLVLIFSPLHHTFFP